MKRFIGITLLTLLLVFGMVSTSQAGPERMESVDLFWMRLAEWLEGFMDFLTSGENPEAATGVNEHPETNEPPVEQMQITARMGGVIDPGGSPGNPAGD